MSNDGDISFKLGDISFKLEDILVKLEDILFKLEDFSFKLGDFSFKFGDISFKLGDILVKFEDFLFKLGDILVKLGEFSFKLGRSFCCFLGKNGKNVPFWHTFEGFWGEFGIKLTRRHEGTEVFKERNRKRLSSAQVSFKFAILNH